MAVSPSPPEWLKFITALRQRGKKFSDVRLTSSRTTLFDALEITDPLDRAVVETYWEKVTQRKEAQGSAAAMGYGTFQPLGSLIASNVFSTSNVMEGLKANSSDKVSDKENNKVAKEEKEKEEERNLSMAWKLSWLVNFLLLAAKIFAYTQSHSQVILASLADSAVDLFSQFVISTAEQQMRSYDADYPVGRNRLEAMGVIACAGIMSMASAFVIQCAGAVFWDGIMLHKLPKLFFPYSMYEILGAGVLAKFLLYLFCRRYTANSDSMGALAEDHMNDVVSNTGAIAATVAAALNRKMWWVDPVSAIIISIWIIYRWYCMSLEQMDKLIGRTAPPGFIAKCNALAVRHHPSMKLDCTRAYHMGSKYAVEMEVVMPPKTTLRDSHDIALALQQKIEALANCERAFVHVDYTFRDAPEHRVERELQGFEVDDFDEP